MNIMEATHVVRQRDRVLAMPGPADCVALGTAASG